jgi:hypothetical protein
MHSGDPFPRSGGEGGIRPDPDSDWGRGLSRRGGPDRRPSPAWSTEADQCDPRPRRGTGTDHPRGAPAGAVDHSPGHRFAAVLIKLRRRVLEDERELPRTGTATTQACRTRNSTTQPWAWWRLDVNRASRYPYAVAIYQGVTRAIYQIDHAKRRRSARRYAVAFDGTRLLEGEAFEAFVARRGRRIPTQRPAGGPVVGTGSLTAYWAA